MRVIFLFILVVKSYSQDIDKAQLLFEKQEWNEATMLFQSILNKDPSNTKAKEFLGDIAAHQKKWDQAIVFYKELVDVNSSNAEYNYKYGGALGMKALSVNKIKALSYISDIKYHLKRASELDENHIDVRWALVELYVSLPGIIGGSEKKAMIYANQLMEISKVDGYLTKGYIAEYSNKLKIAEENYKKAIEVGGSMHTFEKLSDLYEENNEPVKSINNYELAQNKLNRNHLNYQIGKVCAQYNIELDKGLICLENYIKNFSSKDGVPKSWANYRIAQIYRHKKDKRNAYNYINIALKEKPDLEDAIKEKKLILNMSNSTK